MEDKRQTKGKQKIEIKRIDKEENRITTFSKRRSGIYKKATELVTLCGAEVGFGTFSPSGKPFSFAQPSMESIEKRLINIQEPPPMFNPKAVSGDYPLVRAHRQAKLDMLNQRYNELAGSLEAEKEKSKAIAKLVENSAAHMKAKAVPEKGWWETAVEELGYEELLQMKESLQDLHKKFCNHINGERARANNNNVNAPSASAYNEKVFGQGISNVIIADQDPNASSLAPGLGNINSEKNPN